MSEPKTANDFIFDLDYAGNFYTRLQKADKLAAYVTARLAEAAERAVKYQGWDDDDYEYVAYGLRAAILGDHLVDANKKPNPPESPDSSPDERMTDAEEIAQVSPGVFLYPLRAAAEALFRDLTNGWVITSQNGLIDCIEEHMRALSSSTLTDLAIERQRTHHANQRANIAETEENRIKASLRAAGDSVEAWMTLTKRADAAEAELAALRTEPRQTAGEVEALENAVREAITIISPLCPMGNIDAGANTRKLSIARALLARKGE